MKKSEPTVRQAAEMTFAMMPEIFSALTFCRKVRILTGRMSLMDGTTLRRLREARADSELFNYRCIDSEKALYKKVAINNEKTAINILSDWPVNTIEEIACDIWEIPYEKLFQKIREREVVEARMVLMIYRHKTLGMSQQRSAAFYGLNHCSVIHAILTVKNLIATDKVFREKYNLFMTLVN